MSTESTLKKILVAFLLLSIFTFAACTNDDDDSNVDNSAACEAFNKVINGQECKSRNLPVVLLEIGYINGTGICTGTVIGQNHVLTAAHCLVDELRSVVAIHDNGSQSATEFAVNPLYYSSDSEPQYDVAVLRFPRIAQTYGVIPASLASRTNVKKGDTIAIIGYGESEKGVAGTELPGGNPRAANLKVADYDGQLIYTLYDETKTNACFGDSGAAAIKDGKILGVVSGGTVEDCRNGDINFFATVNTSTNTNFIRSVVSDVRFE